MRIPVIDPFGAADDPKIPSLVRALDALEVQREFERGLPRLTGQNGRVHLREIRVTRYKPGRRCLIEYDVDVHRPHAPDEAVILVAKVKARGLDQSTYHLLQALWDAGFSVHSADGVSIPEPIAVLPELHIWLQRKVPGVVTTHLLPEPGGVALGGRIAAAIHKLHRAGVPSRRKHTIADELRILHERIGAVAEIRPQWAGRLARLLDSCERLGVAITSPKTAEIHRDFYADHVIVDGPRLYLLDFDLYCEGDPALDVGNFLGHLIEYSLRTLGNPNALADRCAAMQERFADLAGPATHTAVSAYTTLSLARHVALSTQFPERHHLTEDLLDLCEQRLSRSYAGETVL